MKSPRHTVPTEALPDAVEDALKTALDDEYQAFATYTAIMDKFGEQRPFSNIIPAVASKEGEDGPRLRAPQQKRF